MDTLEQKYEHEKVGKLLVMFSVPSVISLVLNALYNMVDQIFIGNGVGYLGNGATNVIFPLTQLAIAIGLLIGDGTASYMNLKLGEGKRGEAEKGMAAGLTALAVSGGRDFGNCFSCTRMESVGGAVKLNVGFS